MSCVHKRLTDCTATQNQGCQDDQEHGGGKTLLNYMCRQKMYNMALFVVRYYGGVKLGPAHFDLIII